MTFSLLPDCLCARLRGSLDEVEEAVIKVEKSTGVERALSTLRLDIELPGALRFVRRRLAGVRAALLALITAMPGRLGTTVDVRSLRASLGTERALVALREIAAAHLQTLPCPIGFRPLRRRGTWRDQRFQHETGTDPPQRNA